MRIRPEAEQTLRAGFQRRVDQQGQGYAGPLAHAAEVATGFECGEVVGVFTARAGGRVARRAYETTEEEFDQSFAINAKIPYFLMAEAYSKMADDGRIVSMVTTQVGVTAATYSAYAGSKAPVEHFTKAFAHEIGNRGVTVNCIAPGDVGDPVDVVPVMRFLVAPVN